ncbi:MFS transporter [Brucepastera parasyntrophica]|uniref:MFS transporter n=1 Tax=Brucepastera parasyntrophica TaxID=2880008 RepID=UPI00210ACBD7|nr:MFS transporter [Brucepastera parasyntrophica]ULQ59389.1 MFS transporter [Brucepastera parasyntrophica]
MNVSFPKKCLYALGQFGLVLCAYSASNLFISFYVTRGFSGTTLFPPLLNDRYFFGFFTITGLIIALGKIVDALGGVFFGWKSDGSRFKKGRRVSFMLISAVPLAICSFMLFFPPSEINIDLNSVYVLVITVLFYVLLSCYATPYLALMTELGQRPKDRLLLATLLACATSFASLLGSRIIYFIEVAAMRYAVQPVTSFKAIVTIYAVISCICMLLPALLINEVKISDSKPVRDSLGLSGRAVLKDKYFRSFLLSNIMFRIAFASTIAGFFWYITRLLGLSVDTALALNSLIFFINLLIFFPVAFFAQRYGKRKVLFFAALMYMLFLITAIFAGRFAINPYAQGLVLAILVSIPYSVFTVIPNAVVSDLTVAAENLTGNQRGGMYFGIHALAEKTGEMFSTLLFPVIIGLGAKSVSPGTEPSHFGLRLTLIIAAIFTFIGFLFLFGYREREVATLFVNKD